MTRGDSERSNRYRETTPLAPIGGAARVLAVDSDTGRRVQVTTFVHAFDLPESFGAVASRLARVGSPFLAQVLEWAPPDTVSAAPILVELHPDGPTLAETSGLARPMLLGILADVADGLAALHQSGLTHGDLERSAVVLAPGGHPVVLGAGVAALQAIALHAPVGAPTESDDLRAFGGILYETVLGQPPEDPPLPPISLDPSLPAALSGLIVSLSSADPKRPPPPAALVAQRLRALAGLAPIEPPAAPTPVPAAAESPPTTRSTSTDLTLAALVVVIALLGLLLAYAIHRDGSHDGGPASTPLTTTSTIVGIPTPLQPITTLSGPGAGVPTYSVTVGQESTPGVEPLPTPGLIVPTTTAELPTISTSLPGE